MFILKKLLNTPERITYGRLCEVCARHATAVYAKVRLADVLPIVGSGISGPLYDFALTAHYDFVVAGRDQTPLFAVEFDGSQHAQSPQAERDAKKNELSRRFGLPLIRVQAEDLYRTEWQRDKLTELIERWFGDHNAISGGTVTMQTTPNCPLCGGPMLKKPSKFGPFLSCVRYPECKGTAELPGAPNRRPPPARRRLLLACAIAAALAVVIGAALAYHFKFGMAPHGGRTAMTIAEQWDYANGLKASEYPACPRCGKPMVLRKNKTTGGAFFGCSGYPDTCRGTRDVPFPR